MNTQPLVNWAPTAALLLLGLALVALPLAWLGWRHRAATGRRRLHALTLLTLFLTFDLVLFGAFTRLTDSGLGCPDWPGCYGSATPFGAQDEIRTAQSAMPTGPVTVSKAWIEMTHRLFAGVVSLLVAALCVSVWMQHSRRDAQTPSPWWATFTLAWVVAQGAFGALTVTMKLYPAIVTLHLLGGIGLVVLLAAQAQVFEPRPLRLTRALSAAAWITAALVVMQVALGGWVSTNYAVLACREFPLCQGQWWPPMDFAHAFTVQRELGQTASGDYLPFAALTAIHMTHRMAALLVLGAMVWLSLRLAASGDPILRRYAAGIAALAALQLATGLSNVVLGWPIVAALLHTGGAAAMAALLAALLARAHLRPLARARQHEPGWPVPQNHVTS